MRLTAEALADIQGIITSGYGHLAEAAYLFVAITDSPDAQRWLARLLPSITSSRRWTSGAGPQAGKPSTAVNLGVTAAGLAACGLPPQVLCTFPAEFVDGIASAERSRILGDTGASAAVAWEVGGPGAHPVHAVLFLFAADAAALDALVGAHREMLLDCPGATEVPGSLQRGYHADTEPFGFHDGMAQPKIAGFSGEGVPTGEFILGYENHYGFIPPAPVIPAALDPASILPRLGSPYHAADVADLGRHGSFLVYRKLEQDVAGFWRFMASEAARHGSTDPARAIWLASKCVGRWPSGAPLEMAPDADDPSLRDNDEFGYAADADGIRCPIGAHVRRAHPRDGLTPYRPEQSLSMSEAHRLLRRGRVYGPPLFDPAVLARRPAEAAAAPPPWQIPNDGQARGIHFVCVNANLKSQFEFVQQNWCNNPHFSGLNDNTDPLLHNPDTDIERVSRMTIPGSLEDLRTRPVPRFVTVKAGAYLFLPSLTALRFLSRLDVR